MLPPISVPPIILHLLISLLSLVLPHLLHLPSLLLHSLHTYIHPDHLPSSSNSSSLRAAIRRPTSDQSQPKPPRSKSKSQSQPSFDESKAQLLRLRLSHHHLLSRPSFPSFHLSLLLSLLSLSNLLLSTSSTLIPSLSSLITSLFLTHSLLTLSLNKPSHSKSSHQSIFLAFLLAFPLSLISLHSLSLKIQLPLPFLAALIAAALFSPSSRAARSFWLGTDQLRWDLSVVSCGPINRLLLYLSAISTSVSPLLWFHPLPSLEHRIAALLAAAVLQVLVLRPNLQMYLNEAVLCWYQRLHSARAPDLDYGRAKVFLHNHYVCLVATQFLAPPALVMVLLGVSRMRGNLFSGVLFVDGIADCSDAVKECALFLAWWIVFVQGVLMMSSLALYRMGILFVS